MARQLWFLVLCLFGLCMLAALAQDATPPSEHHAHPAIGEFKEVNGATNPELIPDDEAYKMLFVTMSLATNAADAEKAIRPKRLTKAGLDASDSQKTAQIVDQFRARYDDMVKNYNDSALALTSRGEVPDYDTFQRQLLALVKETRQKLEATLSAEGASRFRSHVQGEKRFMRMAVPTGGPQ